MREMFMDFYRGLDEITAEDIERYGHLMDKEGHFCAAFSPGKAWVCTRTPGHEGPHAGHLDHNKLCGVWGEYEPYLQMKAGL